MSALLEISGLTAHYGDFQALFGVDLALEAGQTVAIIGANGAGKTTLMRAITGIARVTAGSILLNGAEMSRRAAPDILTAGIAMVPEGRKLFPSLTVEENLRIGAHARQGNGFGRWNGFIRCSPSCANGATIRGRRCQAGSSRWWQSGGR